MQKRKIHTKAFKLEAVRLLERGDKTAATLRGG
jgi:transposase-like protein